MLTVIAVLLRILSNPLANVFQKQLTAQQVAPLFINGITYVFLGIFSSIYAVNIGWHTFPWEFWVYAICVGLLGALGNGFLIKALQSGDLSVLGPINAYKAAISLLVGVFLLGEVPGIWGSVGIMLIILGSYFVLNTTKERFSAAIFRRKDIQYRLLAMLFAAIEAVLIKKVIQYSSPEVSFIIWCWFGALFSALPLIRWKRVIIQKQSHLFSIHLKTYVLLICCVGLMQLTTSYAFDTMPVGYALALFQLSALVSIFFGYRFFKEGEISRKLLGACIMVAGSVLIILFNK